MQSDKINIEELLNQGKVIQIHPEGYSMYPMFIPGRDEAVIQKAVLAELKRGDVVLYRRKSGMLVLHRIWKRRQDGFYMVGDNQTEIEGPLEESQIKGILLAFIRKGRRIEVTQPIYKAVSRFWLFLRPFRHPIMKVAEVGKKAVQVVRRKKI